MDHSCVQIAIYDNRVEITSPGMLYGGLTVEQAISGRSKIRNVCIAEVFSRMGIIEQWGTGLQRMIRGCREYGVQAPEFIDMEDAWDNLMRIKSSRVAAELLELALEKE